MIQIDTYGSSLLSYHPLCLSLICFYGVQASHYIFVFEFHQDAPKQMLLDVWTNQPLGFRWGLYILIFNPSKFSKAKRFVAFEQEGIRNLLLFKILDSAEDFAKAKTLWCSYNQPSCCASFSWKPHVLPKENVPRFSFKLNVIIHFWNRSLFTKENVSKTFVQISLHNFFSWNPSRFVKSKRSLTFVHTPPISKLLLINISYSYINSYTNQLLYFLISLVIKSYQWSVKVHILRLMLCCHFRVL